ncbi:MAG: O-antigen ligase family protein [Acidobacteriia bacterium]|nr:O-antigen ligase family protein [Terriglobia bacterium]
MEELRPESTPGTMILSSQLISSLSFAVWFLAALNTATTYLWFQDEPKNGTAVSILSSCVMLVLVTLAMLIVGFRRNSGWPNPAKWIFVYCALSGLSLSWTQASSLFSAAGYWIAFFADLLAVIILLSCDDVDRVALAAIKGFVAGTLVVAAIAWAAPGTPDLRMGQEEFLHPNALGFQFALAALFGIYLALRHRTTNHWRWISAALTSSLIRTLSKSSIISFFCSAGVYILFQSALRLRTKLKIAGLAVILLLTSWIFVAGYLQIYTESAALETLTGRTTIWALSWEIARETPWIGHGFYSYRSVVPFFGEFEAWQAHNDLLQQFFSYGIVGVLLAATIYVSFFRHLRGCRPSLQLSLTYALLMFGLIHGLTEASHVDLALPARLMVICAVWCEQSGPISRSLHVLAPAAATS